MSSAHPALDGDVVSNPTSRHGHPTPASVSASVAGSCGSSSPGPWRPASLAGRSSPAFGHSSTFRDTTDNPPGIHSGMTPLRGNGSTSFPERQRTQPVTSSGLSSYGTSSPGSAWTSPSKKSASSSSGAVPTSTLSSSTERSNGNGNEQYFTSATSTASPAHGSLNSFARSSSAASTPMASSSAALSVPTIVADSSSNSSAGMPSGPLQKQPLNMEALAAKFADSKETKEKFAKLQLSPALSPIGLADKERRAPMGSFATPSSSSPHFAHIKVQRTASLNQGSQNSLLPRGSGNRLQPGHLAQSTDMRRTASHNNAFSSGLGMPIGANGGGFEHSNLGFGISTNNGHSSSTAGGSSSHLAPFSLSQLTRPSRQSPSNPSDPSANNQHEQGSLMQTSSLNDRRGHPLQHTWTLYYDIAAGYNRQGSSLHHYENGLRELGMFKTVELFARYFNWIEKPHKMENSANYHLFKDGIKPMWEDPANANGGRWIVTLLNKNPELLDRCWIELAYALVGEQLDAGDDICGAVLSRRTKADRLAVWVREKENVEAINGIGKRLIQMLDLTKEKITLEFQITTDSRSSGPPRSYITLESIRKELAQDMSPTDMTSQTAPSPSANSVSVTPASVTIPSPVSPYNGLDINKVKDTSLNGESHPTIGTPGLLISVEGSEGVF